MTLKPKYPTVAEAEAIQQQRLAAVQADPHPPMVTQSEFIRRSMAADVAAGRCEVSILHPFSATKRILVTDVREKSANRWVLTFSNYEFEQEVCWFPMRVDWQTEQVEVSP